MKKSTFVPSTTFEKMLVSQIYKKKITYKEGELITLVFKGQIKNEDPINQEKVRGKLGITRGYFQIILKELTQKNWISHQNNSYRISNKTRRFYHQLIKQAFQ